MVALGAVTTIVRVMDAPSSRLAIVQLTTLPLSTTPPSDTLAIVALNGTASVMTTLSAVSER